MAGDVSVMDIEDKPSNRDKVKMLKNMSSAVVMQSCMQ